MARTSKYQPDPIKMAESHERLAQRYLAKAAASAATWGANSDQASGARDMARLHTRSAAAFRGSVQAQQEIEADRGTFAGATTYEGGIQAKLLAMREASR